MSGATDVLAPVGVVIVAYRSAGVIGGALASLPTERLADVVVVDNGSPDDTSSAVAAAGRPRVRVVDAGANLGFGGGCNVGLRALDPSATRVLFLNPDAGIDADNLERLVGHLDDHPACAMVAPLLRRGDEPIPSSGRNGTFLTELRPLLPREVNWLLPRRQHRAGGQETGPVGYVEGACMLVRRDALEAIGGFDERYFLYFEELDLAHALRARSWTVDLCAEAVAGHAVATATSALPLAGRPVMIGSTVAYLRKWRGERAVRAYAAAARLSWRLRVRTGDLDRPAADRLRAALERALAGERVVA